MMMALVDSMILMDYDNGRKEAIDWWHEMKDNGWKLCLSIVSLMERLKGVVGFPGRRLEVLNDFLDRISKMRRDRIIWKIYPITREISYEAYELLKRYCERYTPPSKGRSIEGFICDMLIAATAIRYKLILYTFNIKHFDWIDNLNVKIPDYSIGD
mgnify:CR=1 FL=1